MNVYFIWRMDGLGALYRVIDTCRALNIDSALSVAIRRYGEDDIAVTTADGPTYYPLDPIARCRHGLSV